MYVVHSHTTTQKLRSHLNCIEDKYLETPSNARIKEACNAGTLLAIATLVRRIFFFLRFSKANVIRSIFKGREKNLGKVSSFEMKRMEMSQKDEPLL